MHCTVCSVIPHDGDWIAECGAVSHGPYMAKGIALHVATSEALALHRLGKPARVSVQDSAGEIEVEYCLCSDFQKTR